MGFDVLVANLKSKGRFSNYQKRPIKYKLADDPIPFTYHIVTKT